MSNYMAAEPLYRQVLEIRRKALGRLAGNYTKVETIFDLPADDL